MTLPPPDIERRDPDLKAIDEALARLGRRFVRLVQLGLLGFAAFFALGFAWGWSLRAETWPAGSIAVIDGDTVRLPSGEVVRLWAIDAPETARAKCEREAAQGRLATERLGQLLQSGSATLTRCEPAKGTAAPRCRDRFGRTLGALGIAGQDVGEILIREGLATRWPTRPDLCRP
jgi:endonuclease YncB( thermonuclease family)